MEEGNSEHDKQEITKISDESIHKSQGSKEGSIWEKIVLGLLSILIVGPLLIPGVNIRYWVVGLFGSVILFYFVICLFGVWVNLKKLANAPRRRRGK